MGRRLVDGRRPAGPCAVRARRVRPAFGMQWDHARYTMSTVGLGAGASLAQASLHALLEVVENDATALIDVFGRLAGFTQPVEYRRGHHRALDAAMTRIASSGLDCFFVSVARPRGAAHHSRLHHHAWRNPREQRDARIRRLRLQACPGGGGARSLLEAVQSRLTQIAGSRDDLTAQDYLPRRSILRQVRGAPSCSRQPASA